MTLLRALGILILVCIAARGFAADPAYLVKDINTNTSASGSSNPDHFLTFGNLVIFETTDYYGYSLGLWRTDGTDAGTFQIGPAARSKVVWNGRIWFIRAGSGVTRKELWSTDGTSAAVLHMTVTPTVYIGISSLMAAGPYLYFAEGGKLFRTQGTTATTVQIGSGFEAIGSGTAFNGELYFVAKEPGSDYGLWRTGGSTPALVRGLANSGGAYFYDLTPVGSQLFMYWYSGNTGSAQLWRSDGTYAGTRSIRSTQPISILQYPRKIIASTTHAYFIGNDGSGSKLWRTDGTDGGTVALATSMPGAASTFEGRVIGRLANGTILIFGPPLSTSYPLSRSALWAYDGTNTTFLSEVPIGNSAWYATDVGPYSLFGTGGQLWRSDGTIGGTYSLGHVGGSDGYHHWPMTALGTSVYFFGRDETYGNELWRTDGTPGNTMLFKDIKVFTHPSSPALIRRVRGGVVFTASSNAGTSTATRELWFSDGTETGTVRLLADVGPLYEISTCAGRVYLSLYTEDTGTELWSTDGTPAGTRMVKDIRPGPSSGNPGRFACANDQLFFLTWMDSVTMLWKSDGTTAGTLPINALSTGDGGGPGTLYTVGHHVYFSASNGSGYQLFKSDGTAGGTVAVKALMGPINQGVASGSIFFFTSRAADGRTSVWRSDGTPSGTNSFLTDEWITLYTSFGGEAVFHWMHAYTNVGLCRSGGGDSVCFDPGPTSTGGWRFGVHVVNGRMLFNIPSLRVSDGVTSWSSGVGDIDDFLAVAGGRGYPTRNYDESLIETDGTTENTHPILAGNVREAVASGGRLFIGREELYAYDLPVIATSLSPDSVVDGGQTITLTGRGFTSPVSVTVNGSPVAATFLSPTTITFTAPLLTPGAYPVGLTLGDGRQMTLEEPLRYTCSKPAAALEPVTGVLPFGGSVVLQGSGGMRCAWFPGTGLDDPASCTPTAAPTLSTIYTLVVFSENGCASANYPSVRVAVAPQTPTLSYAYRSSETRLTVVWGKATGVAAYDVVRLEPGEAPQVVGRVTGTSFTDTGAPSTVYLYRVRAVNDDSASPDSNADWAHTFTFADATIPRLSLIRAVHLTELRRVIDDIGILAGLPPAVWTDPVITPGVTPVRAAHIVEMRDRIAAAAAAVGKAAPFWSSGPVTSGTLIRPNPLHELRSAVH